jgi:hypothetical protein
MSRFRQAFSPAPSSSSLRVPHKTSLQPTHRTRRILFHQPRLVDKSRRQARVTRTLHEILGDHMGVNCPLALVNASSSAKLIHLLDLSLLRPHKLYRTLFHTRGTTASAKHSLAYEMRSVPRSAGRRGRIASSTLIAHFVNESVYAVRVIEENVQEGL